MENFLYTIWMFIVTLQSFITYIVTQANSVFKCTCVQIMIRIRRIRKKLNIMGITSKM